MQCCFFCCPLLCYLLFNCFDCTQVLFCYVFLGYAHILRIFYVYKTFFSNKIRSDLKNMHRFCNAQGQLLDCMPLRVHFNTATRMFWLQNAPYHGKSAEAVPHDLECAFPISPDLEGAGVGCAPSYFSCAPLSASASTDP